MTQAVARGLGWSATSNRFARDFCLAELAQRTQDFRVCGRQDHHRRDHLSAAVEWEMVLFGNLAG